MFWEHSVIASDWLRLPLIGSPVNEEKTEIKMDDGVAWFFTHFGSNLFICRLVGGAALSRGTQNEIVVS